MKDKILGLLGTDTVVPDQYFDTLRRSEPLEPEKTLLLAVLGDAIHCFLKYYRARDRAGRQQFRDAEEWIMGAGDDWIFSFENICSYLDLSPGFIRRGLRKEAEKTGEPQKRQRRSGALRQAA